MKTSELKNGEIYFCVDIGVVEYVGTEKYQGEVYYNFFNPEKRIFHWIDPENVLPMGVGKKMNHVYIACKHDRHLDCGLGMG